MVFQSYALYPHLTVHQNLITPLKLRDLTALERVPLFGHLMPERGKKMSIISSEVQKVAEILKIEPLLDRKPGQLSGGQRQAVAIARSTAFNAKVVIMDEPTAALAIKEVGKVLDLINSLKKTGVGVIVISHRMDDIFAVCDRVMALFQGTNFAESELSKTSRDEVIGWIMGKK